MAAQKHKTIPGNWRVIVRFSLDYDKSSSVRNAIAPVLRQCGIKRTKTGTWQSENQHCTPASAARQLRKLLRILEDPQNRVAGAGPSAELDHIWFYIERVR
jgi:hypothetical protein